MDVASIRSGILREASLNLPTPVERATARAVEGQGVVAQASLSGASGVEAQIIATRLAADVSSALSSTTRAEAAYGYSVALVREAYERENLGVDLTA